MALLVPTLLLWSLFLATLGSGQEDSYPYVETQYGRLRGKTLSVKENRRGMHAFYGVPFAKPPVGSLRFAPPEPPEPWSSVKVAQDYAPLCLQNRNVLEEMMSFFNISTPLPPLSEDCLYLNIFTPADRETDSRLPVMVFIHGGGLRIGGAGMFEGSALSAYENVVVVSIQYRLGFPGFFSSPKDKQAQGNYGFMDQVAALKWTQENIGKFGGDPNLVTIFGESAGGVSVCMMMISPMARGLFHRAISESGVAIIPNLVVDKDQDLTSTLEIVSNVSACDSASLLDCLRSKTEDEIAQISASLDHVLFPGRVDGKFITKLPLTLLTEKAVAPVPFIIGLNNHEFGYMIPKAFKIPGLEEGMQRDYVQKFLQNIPFVNIRPEVLPLVMNEYFGDTTDPIKIRDIFLDLGGDVAFAIPALRTADYHREAGASVYFYQFEHRPSLYKGIKPEYVKADHGDEIFFVAGGPFLPKGVMFAGPDTEEEKTLSKAVMKYWANFARNGDPNGPGLAQWPQYNQDKDYLQIKVNPSAANKFKAEKFEFWTKNAR